MPKKTIRDKLLAERRHLAAETCLSRSLSIQERFLATPEFAAASTVALYSPIFNEVFTEEILAAASHAGKKVVYPRVRGLNLEFVEVADLAHLGRGTFGVLEPVGDRTLPLEAVDLVALPGVGFDLEGYRLGYGKGFYDRALHGSGKPGTLIGLSFELQLLDSLPIEDHDVRLDLLVTEDRILRFSRDST